jgi:hypothetical protein
MLRGRPMTLAIMAVRSLIRYRLVRRMFQNITREKDLCQGWDEGFPGEWRAQRPGLAVSYFPDLGVLEGDHFVRSAGTASIRSTEAGNQLNIARYAGYGAS